MAKLTQIGTLNGGKVYLPSLTTGYSTPAPDDYVFLLQSRCRIVFKNMTASVRMLVAFNSGASVEMTLFPDVNGEIYMPLNDIFLANFERVRNTSLYPTSTDGFINMYAIDNDGIVLDEFGIIFVTCDCTGLRSGYAGGMFDHILPETYRFPRDNGYINYKFIGCRLTHGVNLIELVSGGNTYSYQQTMADGRAVGCNLAGKGTPSSVKVYEDLDSLIGEARFDLVECMTDKLFLLWWSVEDGIWKSRVADITGDGVDGVKATEYVRDFDDRRAKDSTSYVAVKFSNLSSRDYCYYRDILMSDEVYIIAPADNTDDTAVMSEIPVTVSGTIPETRYNRKTTIAFNVNFSKFSEL